jgi:hypothetical protein
MTEVLPCFFLSCKANARVKLAKTGHGRHSSVLVCICVVRLLFVLFYVLFVCKCVLPPGDNPIAVNKYIISYTDFIVSRSLLLIMRNVWEKCCRENQNTHFVFSKLKKKSYRLWQNAEKYRVAGQATDDNMAHAHCMLDTKGCKYTHSGCVILIAFPLQQWLHEGASMLRNTYIVCLVGVCISQGQ